MCDRLYDFWSSTGRLVEGRAWFDRAIANGEQLGFRAGDREQKLALARALTDSGIIALYQADHDDANRYYSGALEIFRDIDHKRGVMILLRNLGSSEMDRANFPEARRLLSESLVAAREQGDAISEAALLNNLGVTY